METGDSRQAGFSAPAFKSGVKFAMQMGLPGTEAERVSFTWDPVNTYASADSRSEPWDYADAPTTTVSAVNSPASLTLPVAFEFLDAKASSGDTSIGEFDSPRLKITVLDDEYALIQDMNLGLPDGLIVDGNEYVIEYWAPPVALFTVSVYQVFAVARDES